jgi:hypothetical protein
VRVVGSYGNSEMEEGAVLKWVGRPGLQGAASVALNVVASMARGRSNIFWEDIVAREYEMDKMFVLDSNDEDCVPLPRPRASFIHG